MIVHGFFAECITRAPMLVIENRNLVKKVVFPLQLLPWSVLIVAAFHFLVGILLIAAAMLVTTGAVPMTMLALPLIVLPLALLSARFRLCFRRARRLPARPRASRGLCRVDAAVHESGVLSGVGRAGELAVGDRGQSRSRPSSR